MYRKVEYIWIDGSKPTANVRSKTKIIDIETNFLDAHTNFTWALEYFPEWGFDGSSTNQAEGGDSDCILKPVMATTGVAGADVIVLCEVLSPDGTPHPSNTRRLLADLMDRKQHHKPIIGFEQEYTIFRNHWPLGWPQDPNGRLAQPPPQGPYYCGVGADEAYGRRIAQTHLDLCMTADLAVCGINAEVMPGQWEYQIGYRGSEIEPADPLTISDHLWISRWILHRVGEQFQSPITLDVKPMEGDWNGAGCHTNFSTEKMRKAGGIEEINIAAAKLSDRHQYHIERYGHGLEKRLTGLHETCDINTFKWGVADRGASVRIPRHVAIDGKGYLEDRRPGANCDPYLVSAALIETIC
jgi:glutamine synthetase